MKQKGQSNPEKAQRPDSHRLCSKISKGKKRCHDAWDVSQAHRPYNRVGIAGKLASWQGVRRRLLVLMTSHEPRCTVENPGRSGKELPQDDAKKDSRITVQKLIWFFFLLPSWEFLQRAAKTRLAHACKQPETISCWLINNCCSFRAAPSNFCARPPTDLVRLVASHGVRGCLSGHGVPGEACRRAAKISRRKPQCNHKSSERPITGNATSFILKLESSLGLSVLCLPRGSRSPLSVAVHKCSGLPGRRAWAWSGGLDGSKTAHQTHPAHGKMHMHMHMHTPQSQKGAISSRSASSKHPRHGSWSSGSSPSQVFEALQDFAF